MKKIKIRKAKPKDSGEIIKLILELAEFEKLMPPDKKSRKKLIKDTFGKNPSIRILLAQSESEIIGYAIYFFTYSSFLAKKTLYLEDIFISDKCRNRGIGKLFFEKLTQIAKRNNCGRMEWMVLDWNENAIKFYEKLGAVELKEWKVFRFNFEQT